LKKAIFLDRDGTINIEKDYLYKIADFEFIDGMPSAIQRWNKLGFLVIVVTNQSGIARGYYKEKDVEILHMYINEELSKYNAHIDKFYYCPHHPTEGKGKYLKNCNCRKPKTGLLERAIEENDIDISKSYLFGDKNSDLEAGKKLGIESFLVDGISFDVDSYNLFNI
jgi:D-glycero-D-manno-heptose 1,7-bisphosphate phosphatase